MRAFNCSWTLVTKVLCGENNTLKALYRYGIRSMGESRVENLKNLLSEMQDHQHLDTWYLRVPSMSDVDNITEFYDVSLNSEITIIEALNESALKKNKTHHIIIMIELGDLREGILPSSLLSFYEKIFTLSNINVLGIGTNLGCMAGAIPTIDQFTQLILYRELLELKFEKKLPLISAGSSITLPMLLSGELPKAINHFRIGESVFLGTDLINGGVLPYLRDDVIMLEAEIIEIKKKNIRSTAETGDVSPFNNELGSNQQSGGDKAYRALLNIGNLDTDVNGLIPVNPSYTISGGSSDVTAITIGEENPGLKVGDKISFKVNYSAMLRLFSNKYIDKNFNVELNDLDENGMTHFTPLQQVREIYQNMEAEEKERE
jgi:predicted amino acid racemase